MAYKTVANVRDSVAGILTGINLNNVQNLNGALERSSRELCSLVSIPEASGKSFITLYDGVVDYVLPTDIFGASLIDFRPQGSERNIADFVTRQPIAMLDRTKAFLSNGYHLAFEFVKGVGRIRIVSVKPIPRIELDPFTAITGWTAGGSASGLTKDETVFWQSPASLRFTLTGASTGTLTKAITSQDLTDYISVGVIFLAIRTPSASNLTSVTVRLGSDASNYYEVSTTTGFLGAFTAGEWILLALDLSGATTVGSPAITAIDYALISIVHAATLTNFYIGDFWISLPSPHDLIYQTSSFFQASGSNPSQTIVNTADSVLLHDAALVIYEYVSAKVIAQQQGGTLASGLIQQIDHKLYGMGRILGLIDIYRGNNPSEELRQIGNWYDD